MPRILVLLTGLLLLVACGGGPNDPRVEEIRAGNLPADNIIVYDRGRRMTMGTQVLGPDGSFQLAGPTIVYIFRSFAPGDTELMAEEGIVAEENTAYLLPEGETATMAGLQQMQRIGPIDPTLSDDELYAQFNLAQPIAAETPEPETSTPPAAAIEAEDPRDNTIYYRKEDEMRVEILRDALTAAHDSGAPGDQLHDLNLRLAAAQADMARNAIDITNVGIPLPGETACSTYGGFDQSETLTQFFNDMYLEYADGFSSAFIDYKICGARHFNRANYIGHLRSFCAANPDKTIEDSVAAYVCTEPLE